MVYEAFSPERWASSTPTCSQFVLVSVHKLLRSKVVNSVVQLFFLFPEFVIVTQISCCRFISVLCNTYTQFHCRKVAPTYTALFFCKLVFCFLKLLYFSGSSCSTLVFSIYFGFFLFSEYKWTKWNFELVPDVTKIDLNLEIFEIFNYPVIISSFYTMNSLFKNWTVSPEKTPRVPVKCFPVCFSNTIKDNCGTVFFQHVAACVVLSLELDHAEETYGILFSRYSKSFSSKTIEWFACMKATINSIFHLLKSSTYWRG